MTNLSACLNFRQYIEELEEEGDLIQINQCVDPELELAAITRRVYELEERAPLFNNVKNAHPNGLFRILGAPVGLSKRPGHRFGRIAKSLGLPTSASWGNISERLLEAKQSPPIKPRVVTKAPVKENKMFGDSIDLDTLPIPKHHQADGGRYIQTFGMYVVQSPDGNWVNWSITRGMQHGSREIVSPVLPLQDIGVIHQLWKDQGKDMPFALCFGVPPAAIMASGMPLPKWTNESGYVGAVSGEAINVIKCETNELMVPANAEIVFEGTVSATRTGDEGPMGEFHGFVFPGESHPCPVFHVDAITFRNDPILPLCVAGRAPEENHTVGSIMQITELLSLCRSHDLPIKMVWSPFESHMLWHVFQIDKQRLLRMKTSPQTFCEKLGQVVFDSKIGWQVARIYVVGDDIDCTDIKDVVWAEACRCEPGTNDFYFHEYASFPLFPYVSHGMRPAGTKPAKVVKCCMLPLEFTEEKLPWEEASFRGSFPQDLQQKVKACWTSYGFGR